jgi:hypothetical protein
MACSGTAQHSRRAKNSAQRVFCEATQWWDLKTALYDFALALIKAAFRASCVRYFEPFHL